MVRLAISTSAESMLATLPVGLGEGWIAIWREHIAFLCDRKGCKVDWGGWKGWCCAQVGACQMDNHSLGAWFSIYYKLSIANLRACGVWIFSNPGISAFEFLSSVSFPGLSDFETIELVSSSDVRSHHNTGSPRIAAETLLGQDQALSSSNESHKLGGLVKPLPFLQAQSPKPPAFGIFLL